MIHHESPQSSNSSSPHSTGRTLDLIPSFLKEGEEVIKYHRHHDHTAKRMLIWYDHKLHWVDSDKQHPTKTHALVLKNDLKHSASLVEIVGIWTGKHDETFLTKSGQAVDPHLCVTLVFFSSGRMQTLDLSFHSREVRDKWIEAIESMKKKLSLDMEKKKSRVEGAGVIGKILVESETQAIEDAKHRLQHINSASVSSSPPPLHTASSISLSSQFSDEREAATSHLLKVQQASINRFTLELEAAYEKIHLLETRYAHAKETIQTLKTKLNDLTNKPKQLSLHSEDSNSKAEWSENDINTSISDYTSTTGSDTDISTLHHYEQEIDPLNKERESIEHGLETIQDDIPLCERVTPVINGKLQEGNKDYCRQHNIDHNTNSDNPDSTNSDELLAIKTREGRRHNSFVLKKLQTLSVTPEEP